MNRLDDLRITLPANIRAHEDCSDIEFVLLDYNSTDGLGKWVKRYMSPLIASGRLVYYRTEEPKYYSMTHSRNIAFKLSTGDIVCNVDADNFTFDGTPVSKSWGQWLRDMAAEHPHKAVFCKSRQLTIMHGRIGFWKREFVDMLGGYDERLHGYGFDDQDLVERAMGLGFELVKWGGSYCYRIETPVDKKGDNYADDWNKTRLENREKSRQNIDAGIYKANDGRPWGYATVTRNFTTEMET